MIFGHGALIPANPRCFRNTSRISTIINKSPTVGLIHSWGDFVFWLCRQDNATLGFPVDSRLSVQIKDVSLGRNYVCGKPAAEVLFWNGLPSRPFLPHFLEVYMCYHTLQPQVDESHLMFPTHLVSIYTRRRDFGRLDRKSPVGRRIWRSTGAEAAGGYRQCLMLRKGTNASFGFQREICLSVLVVIFTLDQQVLQCRGLGVHITTKLLSMT